MSERVYYRVWDSVYLRVPIAVKEDNGVRREEIHTLSSRPGGEIDRQQRKQKTENEDEIEVGEGGI